jgi:hypothetical protein
VRNSPRYNAGRMRRARLLIGAGLMVVVVSGCATDDREWMKLDQKYTTEEFRRDYRECSRSGKLDDECMRSRGWVAVQPGKADPQQRPDPLSRPTGRQRY